MTDNEANRIIAEFVLEKAPNHIKEKGNGYYWQKPTDYTKSLDALVPVWKKLELKSFAGEFFNTCFYFKLCKPFILSDCNSGTIQQAAAYATAKAILELKDELSGNTGRLGE